MTIFHPDVATVIPRPPVYLEIAVKRVFTEKWLLPELWCIIYLHVYGIFLPLTLSPPSTLPRPPSLTLLALPPSPSSLSLPHPPPSPSLTLSLFRTLTSTSLLQTGWDKPLRRANTSSDYCSLGSNSLPTPSPIPRQGSPAHPLPYMPPLSAFFLLISLSLPLINVSLPLSSTPPSFLPPLSFLFPSPVFSWLHSILIKLVASTS